MLLADSQRFGRFNFDKAEQEYGSSNETKNDVVKYLRGLNTDIDWESLDSKAQDDAQVYDFLKADNTFKIHTADPNAPIKRYTKTEAKAALESFNKEGEEQSLLDTAKLKGSMILDQLTGYQTQALQDEIQKAKVVEQKLKGAGLKANEFESKRLVDAKYAQKNILSNLFDTITDVPKRLVGAEVAQETEWNEALERDKTFKKLAKAFMKGEDLDKIALSKADKANIEDRLGFVSSWWRNNSQKEQIELFLDLVNADNATTEFVKASKMMENVLKNHQFFGLLSSAETPKEKRDEMLKDFEVVASHLGFDEIAFNQSGLYFIKDGKPFKVEENFNESLLNALNNNKGSLALGIAGAARGAKSLNFPKMVVGGASGAFLGGTLDSLLTDAFLDKDFDIAQALLHGAQESALNIAGDAVFKVAGTTFKAVKNTGLKGLVKTGDSILNYTPLVGFLKRAKDGNKAAADKLLNHSVDKEQVESLEALFREFGGDFSFAGEAKTKNFKAQIAQKFGADSFMSKGANAFIDTFTLSDSRNAQKNFIRAIRADESGNLLAFLTEAANASPVANNHLRTLLNKTTQNLHTQLRALNFDAKDIREVYTNLATQTKMDYANVMENILGKIYDDSYKVVLSRGNALEGESAKNATKAANLSPNVQKEHDSALNLAKNQEGYDYFRKTLNDEGVLPEEGAAFLKFVEQNIYNPKGVTFKQLHNAQKTLNAYYRETRDPNFKHHIKNAIEGFLRDDIKRGIEQIFALNKGAYEDAKTLFETSLSDYGKMKEALRLVDRLKLRDEGITQAKAMDNLLKFLSGQGDGSIPNIQKLTQHLPKEQKTNVELSILYALFEQSIKNIGQDMKIFDSSEFFKRLEQIQGFETKSAQDFIDISKSFHTLFKNDFAIAKSLKEATTQRLSSSIATTLEGAVKFQLIKELFSTIVRLMPHIPFAKGFNEKVQGAALRYHIKKALEDSISVNEFKLNLKAKALNPHLNTPTKQLLDNFLTQTARAQDEIISAGERASLGDLTESVESRTLTGKGVESVESSAGREVAEKSAQSAAKSEAQEIPLELQEAWKKEFNLESIHDDFIPNLPQAVRDVLGGDVHVKIGSLVKLAKNHRAKYLSRIKPTLETPNAVIEHENSYIFVRDFGEEKYFTSVVKDDSGEWIVRSNAPKSANNLNNKIQNGAKVVYGELPSIKTHADTPYEPLANFQKQVAGADSSIESKIAQDSMESTESKALESIATKQGAGVESVESSAGREVAEKSAQSAAKSEAQESAESSYKTLENGDIVFKDNKGKEHILDKQTQDLWKNTFNLKNIDDEIIPQIPQEIAQQLGKTLKFKIGSLFKIVSRKREKYIPHIKETFENPQAVFIDNEGALIFAKKINDKQYFTSINVDKGEYFVSISLSPKTNNNLENKLKNAKEVYRYPNPESNSPQRAFTDTTSRANNSDKTNSTIESKTLQKEAGEQKIFKMQDVKIDTMEDFTKYAQMVGIEFKDEKQAKEAFKFIRRVGGGLDC